MSHVNPRIYEANANRRFAWLSKARDSHLLLGCAQSAMRFHRFADLFEDVSLGRMIEVISNLPD